MVKNIPLSLKYIKLNQYQKFLSIEKPSTEDLLKCVLSLDSSELSKLKATEVDKMALELNNLFETKQTLVPTFSIYGTKYGFIPNLDEITYGENKDITSYINDWDSMHKAMAVLYRPIKQKVGDKYIIEEYEGSHVYSEVMKDMPLNVVMGAMVFFYNLTNVLLKSIPSFLEKEIVKEQMQGVISQGSGEVIQSYIHSLRETLQDLKKLQSFPYINA
tara:strand:+ start:136 stop:786 length:651 start_codon:yes stop_codon:yes gene_type:complete